MNKHIISLIISVVMVMSILVTGVPVYAANKNGLNISATEGIAGDMFSVILNIPAVTNVLENTEFNVTFDNTVFEVTEAPVYTGITGGTATLPTAAEVNSNGFYSLNLLGTDIQIGEGAMLTARFKVKEDAAAGSYDFKLTKAAVSYTDEILGIPVYALKLTNFTSTVVAYTITNETTTCVHENKITHSANDSTCNALGNNLYYTCNDCQKVFKADGTTETTVEAETFTEYGEHVEATPATCTTLALCSVCNQGYGEFAAHEYKVEWNQGDANGHWHDCKNCSAHDEPQVHIPGAAATETTAQICTECSYVIAPATGHITHTADTSVWLHDETTHWHKCVGCDEKMDVTAHTGGEATCNAKAKCSVCEILYGEVNAANHKGETEVRDASPENCKDNGYTGDIYCKDCGAKIAVGTVIPATGAHVDTNEDEFCDVCNTDLSCQHSGATEIRDIAEATCGKDGYTGDTYCKECGKKIADGTVIPATGVHQGGEATCIEPAKCAVCEASYGTVNADNHKGETEIRDASPASCKDDGYTGDTYCKDCDKKIANGAVIPATGAHVDTDSKWESDGENHWHTCACGMKIDSAAHTGGEATCVELAKCAVCEASYGTVNAENHKGETEIRGAYAGTCDTNGYSGDVYCKDCNVKLQDGTATPFEHLDENGDAYCDLCDVLLCKHNHVQVVNVKFENCVKDGYTGDTYCIDCGALLEKGDVTPATNRHTPGDWVVGKEATETEAGYLYQGCTVCGAKLATEVIPQLEAEWVNPFKDVSEDAWYYDDVKYAYVNGLILGTDTNKFSPDMALSRAQLVTILWRLDDEAKAESAAFTDVADGMWYTEAIDWATANGIVLGYNDGRFGPDDTITREQVMLILNRYAEYKGWTTDASTTDTADYKYSTWAEKGVLWAAANGMFNGIGVDVTDLTVTADRAEIAAYLKLFVENIAE